MLLTVSFGSISDTLQQLYCYFRMYSILLSPGVSLKTPTLNYGRRFLSIIDVLNMTADTTPLTQSNIPPTQLTFLEIKTSLHPQDIPLAWK